MLALAVSLLGLLPVSACGSGGAEYAVGDCIMKETNQNGAAQKSACTDPNSITITKLVKNGGTVNCPYYMPDGPQVIQDVTTQISYCGHLNRSQ